MRGFYIYGEVSGIGKIYTPKNLRNRMLEIAQPKKTDKILILYNLEFASDLRDHDYVFASDDLDKNEIVEQAFGKKTVFIEDNRKISESLKKVLENMKFDLIISNPPYNRNLDLKILKDVYNLSEKICFVHPAGWAYAKKQNLSKLIQDVRKITKNHFCFCEKVENANIHFNINLFIDVFITLFDKKTKNVIEIDEIDVHGNSKIYKNLKKKILSYCNKSNLLQYTCHKNNKNFEVGIAAIRGNPGTSDFYTFIQLSNESVHIGNKTKYPIKYSFDSETEAINFKDYLKTKIARFCLSIYKINQHLVSGELASVPYMPTYERSWTDEDVAKELDLTEEELIWTINWIPDYYPEDPEIYAKWKN